MSYFALMDSSRVSTCLISMLLIVYGSFRSLNMEQEAREKEKRRQLNESTNNLLTGEPVPIEQSNLNVKSVAWSGCLQFKINDFLTKIRIGGLLFNFHYSWLRYPMKLFQLKTCWFSKKGGFFSDNGFATLDTTHALCLPLGASVSLLVMFFFFDSMQMLFAVCTASKCSCFFFKQIHLWKLSLIV